MSAAAGARPDTRLRAARRLALEVAQEAPIDADRKVVMGVRANVLAALTEAGLLVFYPKGRPPSWKITAAGRRALRDGRLPDPA